MKSQLQVYNPNDLQAERKLVATLEGQHTQDAINAWYAEQIKDREPLVEGLQYTIIPSDHAWFMQPKPTITPGPNNNPNAGESKDLKGFVGEFVSPDKVLMQSRKVFERDRLAKLEQKRKLREFLANNK